MAKTVLVINSGSSSIKYQLVDLETGEGIASGLVEKIGEPVDGHYKHEFNGEKHELEEPIHDHEQGLKRVLGFFNEFGPKLDEAGIDPWHDVLSLEQFRAAFGAVIHPFTGVDYVDYYKTIIESAGAEAEIVFANRVQAVLDYTDTVICCDIHTRKRSKRLLAAAGAKVVLGLDDLLTSPVDGSGYNLQYGLLGSNKADDDRVKLFPRDAKPVAEAIGKAMSEATGKRVEAMVYGDGAFKDPAGKIWELADPVVSPGYTSGLVGTPNELKLKYLADKEFAGLSGQALKDAISQKIREKDAKVSLVGNMVSEGTTPRNLTDLIGSLCDLTSGSGDKGTPIVYIQGYFDNYTNE